MHFIRILVPDLKNTINNARIDDGTVQREAGNKQSEPWTVTRRYTIHVGKFTVFQMLRNVCAAPSGVVYHLYTEVSLPTVQSFRVLVDTTAELNDSVGSTGHVLYKYILENQNESFGLCIMPFDRRLAENKACSCHVGQATS